MSLKISTIISISIIQSKSFRSDWIYLGRLYLPRFIYVDNIHVVSTIGRDTEPIVVDSETLVAPEYVFLIGGDTTQTVDVSDLPQKTEGGVTGRTETASRSPSTTRHGPQWKPNACPQRKPKLDNGHLYQCFIPFEWREKITRTSGKL